MAKTAVATRGVDLEPIDRLEEKVKLLVGMIDRFRGEAAREKDENARLRSESARAAEENTRLRSELESARARLSEAEGSSVELTALRDEREHIRGRVADMLSQIEALNL
jgi:FtsZ-binding cell division protein ZapB